MPHFEKHVFICTNERDKDNPKGDCKHKGCRGHPRGLQEGAASSAGSRRRCAPTPRAASISARYGPAVVVYPEQIWYTVPTKADAEEIIEKHLVGGVPVERLFMRTGKDAKDEKDKK